MPISGFFAVGQDTFHRACNLGITEGCAFLVLARGSGPDNITSSWSSKAVSDRMGTRWSAAKEAIDRLAKAKLVTIGGTKERPSYKLAKKGEDVWLPNTLIDGLANQPSPIERVRQTQEPMILRLLVDFYSDQKLPDHGGISTKVVYGEFSRTRLGEHAQYVVWGFDSITTHAYRSGAVVAHSHGVGNKWSADDFFKRFKRLLSLHLVEFVPILYEGPQGEPIHPMHKASRIPLEAGLAVACEEAALRALSYEHHEIYDKKGWPDIVAIVPAHIEHVTMIGTFRLAYRPQTSLTSAWWGQFIEEAPGCIRRYNEIAPESSESAQYA